MGARTAVVAHDPLGPAARARIFISDLWPAAGRARNAGDARSLRHAALACARSRIARCVASRSEGRFGRAHSAAGCAQFRGVGGLVRRARRRLAWTASRAGRGRRDSRKLAAFDFAYAAGTADEYVRGETDKDSARDHAVDRAQPCVEIARIVDRAERAVENIVAVVRHERFSVAHPHAKLRTDLLNLAFDVAYRERNDLDGQRKFTETRYELTLVDDDDEFVGGERNGFLAEERAAAAFRQRKIGSDFIGAVDCDPDR